MESKNNKVVSKTKTKTKYKYNSPFLNFAYRSNDSSVFAIIIYTLLEIVYIFYYLYKISPLFIRILFWLIIVALIIWIATRPIKEIDNSTTTHSNTTTTSPNTTTTPPGTTTTNPTM
jgi:hypothetical protein